MWSARYHICLAAACLLFAGGTRAGVQHDDTPSADTVGAETPYAEDYAPEGDIYDGIGSVGSVSEAETWVYVFPIREDIMPSTVRLVDKCLRAADEYGADIVVIDMNTYGGLVNAADSIRTRILNHHKPVWVFINNQAVSAGALISIAADRIYMRDGASIGAATVVEQDGDAMPDKYQSFMRGMMRSTAESHGKVPATIAHGDTTWRWYRDPLIAEGMVDPTIVVPGIVDDTKVITFSTEEALKWHYCEGKAANIEQLLSSAGVENYIMAEYTPTALDRLLGFLTNPAFQGVMIMLIIGGIYFELQTPGIGFPILVSIIGALLYFSPLYLEGLVSNWELLVFIVGLILIFVEIFVTPGFGVLGIAGIVAVFIGLAFATIDSEILKHIPTGEVSAGYVIKPIGLVIIAVTASLIISIYLGKRVLTTDSALRERVVLTSSMNAGEGYISHDRTTASLVGSHGRAVTNMRPAGKVMIDGSIYDSAGENGVFITRGTEVVVIRMEAGTLFCREMKVTTDGPLV